jgi:phosphoadenosine phosphosulfate reductase
MARDAAAALRFDPTTPDSEELRASPWPATPAAPPGDEAELLLQWAASVFGQRSALLSSLGPQSLLLVDMLARLGLRIPVLLLDTGLLFAETYALRRRVEERYGIAIRAVRPRQSLAEQAAVHGPRLWERDPDTCCRLRKVEPLRQALSGLDAWITGIRGEQSESRAASRPVEWDGQFGLIKVNPLLHWDRRRVFAYLLEHGVPYNPLLDQGYPSVGCRPCTVPVDSSASQDERAGRWAGRAKTECGIHHRLQVISR